MIGLVRDSVCRLSSSPASTFYPQRVMDSNLRSSVHVSTAQVQFRGVRSKDFAGSDLARDVRDLTKKFMAAFAVVSWGPWGNT